MPSSHPIQALQKGPHAHRALEATRLSVMAVFTRTVYARTANGALLCLAGPDLPLGPFTLTCSPWERINDAALTPEDHLDVDPRTLRGQRGLAIDFSNVQDWTPSIAAPNTHETLSSGMRRTLALLPHLASREGLASLLQRFSSNQVDTLPSPVSPFTVALLKAGRLGLDALWQGLASNSDTSCHEATQCLLGLGPGLTPSGDDVLGGALLALRMLGRSETAALLAHPIDLLGPAATNPISLAYLHAAAQGCASSVLHDALNAVFTDSPALESALRGLDRMGHSSGWDSFLGAFSVLMQNVCPAADPFSTP